MSDGATLAEAGAHAGAPERSKFGFLQPRHVQPAMNCANEIRSLKKATRSSVQIATLVQSKDLLFAFSPLIFGAAHPLDLGVEASSTLCSALYRGSGQRATSQQCFPMFSLALPVLREVDWICILDKLPSQAYLIQSYLSPILQAAESCVIKKNAIGVLRALRDAVIFGMKNVKTLLKVQKRVLL